MEKSLQGDLLDSIHDILKLNHQTIPEEKQKEADQKILPFLEKIEFEEEEISNIHQSTKPKIRDASFLPYVIKYYAMTQDNVELLEQLEKENYLFSTQYMNLGLFVLDQKFSSCFLKENYLPLILKHSPSMKLFYESVRKLPDGEKEKFYRDFSEVIQKDSSLLEVPRKNGELSNIVTKKNLENFGKDVLLGLDFSARQLLVSLPSYLEPKEIEKVQKLLQKKDVSLPFSLTSEMLHFFSVEELTSMNGNVYEMYQMSIKKEVFPRMRQLLQKDPNFRCPLDMIRYEIFHVLSDEEILSLSEEAMEELAFLKIPQVQNVSIFPVLKIHQILMKDHWKKKFHGKS